MLNFRIATATVGVMIAAAAGMGFMAGRIAPGGPVAVLQPEGMEEMMRLYEEQNRTGEHHRWLAKLAGEWDAQITLYDPASGEGRQSKGIEMSELIFDGRYLKATFEGDRAGGDGLSLMGYNNAEQRFESVWVHSTDTAIMFSAGERQGDTLILTGEFKESMSGQLMQFRHVLKIESPTRHTFTGYHTMGGQEMKAVEIVYTRRGDDPDRPRDGAG